jgi:hypothetical protein
MNTRGQLSLESLGEPFDGRNVEVNWAASTDAVPAKLEVFRTVPASFSLEIISNLVTLVELKNPAKAAGILSTARQGKPASLTEAETGKYLAVTPATGYICYYDRQAVAMSPSAIRGVPTDDETLALARRILATLSISESNFVHKPRSVELERSGILEEAGGYDKQERVKFKVPVARGLILFRQINGIGLSGPGDCGGFRVEFGNDAKIKELAVSWRGIKPERLSPTAEREDITKRIKEGRAVINIPAGLPPAHNIRKLRITSVRPYYLGQTGDEPQKFIFPYLMLTAEADMGHTNGVVSLNCPILR